MVETISGLFSFGFIACVILAVRAKRKKTGNMKRWILYALGSFILTGIAGSFVPAPKQENATHPSSIVATSSNTKEKDTAQKGSDTRKENTSTNPSVVATTTTSSTTATSDSTVQTQQCRQDPLAGVYHPNRLKVISNCKTVSGTIVSIKNEADDDYHINLQLDSPYANLINDKNVSQEHGALVVEVIPMDRPNISRPSVGEKLTVTGAYVVDGEHGWMEIHPAWIVNNQGTVNYTAEAAQKSVIEGVCGNGDKDCEGGSTTTTNTSSSSSTSTSSTTSTSTENVKIINVSSRVSKGSEASVTAQVKPGSSASITVYYNSGPSNAAGLVPKNADGNGNVSWQWKVGTRTASGTYQIVVNSNGQSATTNFTVD